MVSRKEKAVQNFYDGYNCTQSIVLAFEDLFDVDKQTLLKMASPFGGGMGRLREVCGSVSGMYLVLGQVCGYEEPKNHEVKAGLYTRVQELAHRFEKRNGSIVCRELLGLDVKHESPVPQKRTTDYYKKRPCPSLIGDAAEILEDYLKEEHLI